MKGCHHMKQKKASSNWFFLKLFIITLLLIGSLPKNALASTSLFLLRSTTYYVDGKVYIMDTLPYIKDNRTYLPVRYVANALGIEDSNIMWDGASKTIILSKGDKIVHLRIGIKKIYINGSEINMDVAPEVSPSNRTMLPAAWVAQAFGSTASWDPEYQSVTISDDQTTTESTSTVSPSQQPDTTNAYIKIPPYEWNYKLDHWKWDPQYSETFVNNLLEAYRNMPHPHRIRSDYLTTYCVNKSDGEEKLLSTITQCLKNGATKANYNEYDTVCYVIAFVQSFTYVSDSASTGFDEYPRYPLETLFSREGDCEDTAILTAKLIRELGYGSALLLFDTHCAVGVKGADSLPGTYYEVNGARYYYLETTAKGWGIGQVPEEYRSKKALVLPLP